MARLPDGFKPAAQGHRLSALLDRLGWKQKQLSIRTGISKPVISKLVTGQKNMRAEHAVLIASATGLTTDYLLTGSVKNLPLDLVRSLAADD